MKIMLSSVGNRDPLAVNKDTGEKSFGPLITVAQEIKPDVLIMLPTRQQLNDKLSYTEDRCDEIERELKVLFPKMAFKRMALDLPDPTDYHDILTELSKRIEEIKEIYKNSQVQYYLNVSSATPQIQASFLIMVSNQRLNASVYQARDPYYVEAGQERVREIDVQFIEEENQINRAKIFYSKNYFSSAADELLNLALATRKIERERMAELYSDLLRAYHWVDLYQHERALDVIKKITYNLRKLRKSKLLSIVKQQEECLEKIISLGEKEGYENICDLYHNTCRRLEMEQYIDCLSRFKRVYEGCYFFIARNELNIKNPNKKIEEQPQLAWVCPIINRSQGRLNIYDIANIYENKIGKKKLSIKLEQELNSFSNKRNYTINNHGMNSVSKDDAIKAVRIMRQLLEQVFPGQPIDDYPFSASKLKEIEQIIFQDL
jgi:hypothetical protein